MSTNGLTRKQKNFVEGVVEHGNGTKAALDAYDTDSPVVAASIAYENLSKPQILNALQEALPDELLAQIHREGLFATRPIFDKEGNNVGEDADFTARARYLELAYKVKGSFAPEKKLTVHVEAQAIDPRIRDLARKLNS